jgi:hypothetical protein
MYRQLTSVQLMEVRAYARIDAVPDSEIEQQDRLEAARHQLSEKAKAHFGRVFKK